MSVNGGASRRAVLLGAGAVGAAGVLAACAGGGEPSGSPQPPAATTSGGGGTTMPAPSGTSGTPAPEGIAVADVPVGGGHIDPARRVVVTQPEPGQFRAFDATCTHEFCMVSSVDAGLITCNCHGSQFRITDGSVARGPAMRRLDERAATVTNGVVVIS